MHDQPPVIPDRNMLTVAPHIAEALAISELVVVHSRPILLILILDFSTPTHVRLLPRHHSNTRYC
jgi:hypothetical protein